MFFQSAIKAKLIELNAYVGKFVFHEGCKRESKGNMESNLCAVTCNKNCRVLGYEKMVTIYVNRYMHVANNYSATKNVWIFGETEQGERLKLAIK